ncbi:MAG: hypothetical protein KDB14_32100, partial [Planctomycetales bacterium]|nr:hypothetical protein [Planctomycetales bacterium]
QASGGHPDAPERSVIRRWTAPLTGVVRVSGALSHPSPNGDGVHGLLVHSSKDRAQAVAGAAWTAAHGSVETNAEAVEVQAGDTLDLIVESGSTITSDSFAWRATLELTAGGQRLRYDAERDFAGPAAGEVVASPTAEAASAARAAWQLALGRDPSRQELVDAVALIARQVTWLQTSPERPALAEGTTPLDQAVTDLCQVLLSCNEFLYVD